MTELRERLNKAKVFTKLGLKNGYHLVRMAEYHEKTKMCHGAPVSVRTHEIAQSACCVGNELYCTLAPHANVGGFCVLFQSGKALRSGSDFLVNLYSDTTT